MKTPRGQVLLQHVLTAGTFGLFIGGDFFGLPQWLDWAALALGVAAVAIAVSRRGEGMPWARTHHEVAVRTLIIGACASVTIQLASLIPGSGLVAPWVMLALVAWIILRVGAGLVRGALRLPFENPRTMLI